MCLIAYSPKGAMIDRSVLAYAYHQNDDGIGVMSVMGIEKFMGRKALKRARRYLETVLVPDETPYAIHFRWATHGDVKLANTHPYENAAGTHWIMHNGVLSMTTAESSADESDTAVYVRKFLSNAPAFDDKQFWSGVEKDIGWGNKFCVMDGNGEFLIVNDDAGTWINGIWFSNTYSLPSAFVPVRNWGGYHNTYSGVGNYYSRSEATTCTPYRSNYGYTDSENRWTPKEFWDPSIKKMIPNPRYKESEHYPERFGIVPAVVTAGYADVAYHRDSSGETVTRILGAGDDGEDRWSGEDRRAYYESLEAGLTPDEAADYDDIGTRAAMVPLSPRQTYVLDKPDADIGGDFADPQDDEEQSAFRKYLAKVARGIHL